MSEFFEYNSSVEIRPGCLLISEPYLPDPNFERTVILMCEHNHEGSFGFVMNKPSPVKFNDVIDEVDWFDEKLYIGGPVQQDTLHFIYTDEVLEGSTEISENLYWGGNFEQLLSMVNTRSIDPGKFRFFLGYSGWSEGQLMDEITENSWIVSNPIPSDLLINTKSDDLWKLVLKKMGGKFEIVANFPVDPRMN